MSTQAPQLEKGDMAAAERANLQFAERAMLLLVKLLRQNARNYPPTLRAALSAPNDTHVEISFGGEKAYSATIGAEGKVKQTALNTISESQAEYLQEALTKQKGETMKNPLVRNMRILVNGTPLFEIRDGKCIQNDLPTEFGRTITAMIQPRPTEVPSPASEISLNAVPPLPSQGIAPSAPRTGPAPPISAPSIAESTSVKQEASHSPITPPSVQTTSSPINAQTIPGLDQSLVNGGWVSTMQEATGGNKTESSSLVNAQEVERCGKKLVQCYGDGQAYRLAATHSYKLDPQGSLIVTRQSDGAMIFANGELTEAATAQDIQKLNSLPTVLQQIQSRHAQQVQSVYGPSMSSQHQESEMGA